MIEKVTVIIPAYNEEVGIGHTLSELCANVPDNYNIVVLDDGSSDATYAIASSVNPGKIKVFRHNVNRGYGSAIKSACRYADGDVIAWYDADGQHRPEDLIRVVDKLITSDLDYVIGVRTSASHVDPNRRWGKKILSWIANRLAREPMEDVNSGLRAFRRSVLIRHVSLLPNRFGASTVTSFIMQEMNYRGGYSSIVVRQREGISTVKPVRDGIVTLNLIVNIILLFRARQVLTMIAAVFLIVGTVYGLIRAFIEHMGFPVLSAIVILAGIQIYFLGLVSAQISAMRLENVDLTKM